MYFIYFFRDIYVIYFGIDDNVNLRVKNNEMKRKGWIVFIFFYIIWIWMDVSILYNIRL